MKKVILTLVFCLSFVWANAQIQRSFFGATLGVSSWNDTKSKVKQKGLEILDSSPNTGTLILGNATFAGYPCEYAIMYFHKNVLYKVFFLLKAAEQESEILPVYDNFKKKLKDKYSAYITTDDDNSITLDDKVSFVYLGHSYSNGMYDTGLLYTDKTLDNQRKQADKNEL